MLCPLERVQPNGVNNMNDGGYTCLNMIVDSGACDSVIPTEMLPTVPISTQNAQFGSTYQVANGDPISNEGEKSFQAITNEGSIRTFNMQVAKVDKPLLSVSGITKRGNRVVFDPHGSYIENCITGEFTQIHEINGMYVLPTWVPGF